MAPVMSLFIEGLLLIPLIHMKSRVIIFGGYYDGYRKQLLKLGPECRYFFRFQAMSDYKLNPF